MARSIKKGPFVDASVTAKVAKVLTSGRKEVIKTWSRRSTIMPDFVGIAFAVHNGNKFIPVLITDTMIGHKLGEFAPTRTFNGHPDKKAVTAAAAPAKKK